MPLDSSKPARTQRIRCAGALRAVAAGGALLTLGLSVPAISQARVGCAYAGAPQHTMTVTVTGTSDSVVRRRGDEIVAYQRMEAPEPCSGGVPTVHNTDTIHVVFTKSDDRAVELQLGGGPFAPGASPEPDGAPEIEINVRGDTGLSAAVVGTPGDDHFRWVAAGTRAGLNLNPGAPGDHDADVTTEPVPGEVDMLLVAMGAGGDDTIVGDPTARDRGSAFTYGGPGDDVLGAFGNSGSYLNGDSGNDVLVGGALDDILSGAAGNDRISGKGDADRIYAGRGADRIDGGTGPDRITTRDATRDSVTCGSGRDRVDADRRDVLLGCERRDESASSPPLAARAAATSAASIPWSPKTGIYPPTAVE